MKKLLLPILCAGFFAACTDDPAPGAEQRPGPGDLPEYTYSQVEFRRLVNGQFRGWTVSETIAGGDIADATQTRTVAGMNWFRPVDFHVETPWGGRLDYGEPVSVRGAEGFFRVAKAGDRWYFLDPDGGAVILRGTQHVRPYHMDDTPTPEHEAGYKARFSSDAAWSAETGSLLASNGFNYISYGAKRIARFPDDIRSNLLCPAGKKLAYGENLYLLRTFMWDMKSLGYGQDFDSGKYNRLVLAFEPKFAEYAGQLAQEKCALFRDDEHFVGYYLDNELPFVAYEHSSVTLGVELAHFLSLPDDYSAARDFAQAFMTREGIASEAGITEAHREKFRAEVADHYFRVTTEAVRKADPNHLILGARLHDWSKYTQGIVEACARYCDVVSVNYYSRWQPEPLYMANLATWCGERPFIISEFYVKADDASYKGRPYPNTDGGGWLVRTQRNRGEFYQNFCLRLLETRRCAGWMHFEYTDGYSGGRGSNKGIVSVEYQPYADYLSMMKTLHANLYRLASYYDADGR
ncbi:hypothetical protein [uncultured Alistipes sp.]|uniref:hypothetical protein n=1 Tax=uncultured Alistipes sp. TaxID=538949 RepID=UPI00272D8124|nr:hypothetical protein [uncultured Alistipes sp.]